MTRRTPGPRPRWRLLGTAQLAVLVAAGCAKPLPPPGGPIDTTPPRVVRVTPADRSTAQDTLRALQLEFSESMDRRSVRAHTLLSPSPGPLQWQFSGRTGMATFAHPLAPHTTYTLTLPSALADLKGNHLTTPLRVRFSTGAGLDSGVVSGTVSGRRTRGDGAYVLLRRDAQFDTVAALVRHAQRGEAADGPLAGASIADLGEFVARADAAGGFIFDAVPDGLYAVAALADRNGNRAFDPDRDAFAVACDPVEVRGGSPVTGVRLTVGDEDERPGLSGVVVDSLRLALRDSANADSVRRLPVWVRLEGDSARAVRADSLGAFRLTDLAPGRYTLHAFRDLDGDSTWAAGREPTSDSVTVCLGWAADLSGLRLVFAAPPVVAPQPPEAPAPEPAPITPPRRKPRRSH